MAPRPVSKRRRRGDAHNGAEDLPEALAARPVRDEVDTSAIWEAPANALIDAMLPVDISAAKIRRGICHAAESRPCHLTLMAGVLPRALVVDTEDAVGRAAA